MCAFSQYFVDPSSVKYQQDDTRIRFYDDCERYVQTIEKNKSLLVQYATFKVGTEMNEVLNHVVADNKIESLGYTVGKRQTNPVNDCNSVIGQSLPEFGLD